MRPAIRVEKLSKKYRISHRHAERYTTLRDALGRGVARILRGRTDASATDIEDFWALRDVDFEIQPGGRVGIIGRNGAGKSTLLKVLSRITQPTYGRFSTNGRIASLLEVGTGFHPELSGRENIYLNGALLGMGRAEIRSKFSDIVEFAEVERFLDTPVKRYSSGMYVRLAFAIAANLAPDILIVDEVLAVGDAQFQKKCLGRMDEIGNQGCTLIFVSHNMAMISNLCREALLLEQGRVAFTGDVGTAIARYYESGNSAASSLASAGSERVGLLEASIVCARGPEITLDDEFSIRMSYRVRKNVSGKCVPNFHLFSADGICVFVSSPSAMGAMGVGDYVAECTIPGRFLNEGTYFVGVAVTTHFDSGAYEVDFFEPSALTFTLVDEMNDKSARYNYAGPMPGVVRPSLQWRINSMGS